MKRLLTVIIALLAMHYSANAQTWLTSGNNVYYHTNVNNPNFADVGIGISQPTSLGANTRTMHILGQSGAGVRFGTTLSHGYVFAGQSIMEVGTPAGTNTTLSFLTNGSNRLHITTGGNVGIGTSNPKALFSLGQSINPTKLAVYDDGTGNDVYGLGVAGYQFRFHVGSSAARFSFLSSPQAGTDLMTIKGNGNVGIGGIDPTEKLHISGNLKFASESNAVEWLTSSYQNGFGHKIYSKDPIDGSGTYLNIAGRHNSSTWVDMLSINSANGNVGIGTAPGANTKLAVEGLLAARQIKVLAVGVAWPDYVFNSTYKLTPLFEVEQYIQDNKHLPNVPSAVEVEKDGIELAQMDAILLRKIEELTLYMIELKKENEILKKQIKDLGK